ncbi:hypothetical protein LVD15_17640 [Fulvivirga maritima]|uniref:hypothetical protein n=1 Tax=Fulvivirga maritima TaxID=2904247 RepID=UPI001F15BF86|nr:hypothetical protein [Fulvivirga maritima]UII25120.1 hypothetical protein LVD15_17640 [Fulvivirga maritima]
MKSKCIFLLIFIFSFQGAFSQNVDSTLIKQLYFIKKISYGAGSSLFNDSKLYYKTKEADELPWKRERRFSEKELVTITDTLIHNSELSLNTGKYSGTSIRLFTTFPRDILNIDEVFRIQVEQSNLLDSMNNIVTIDPQPSVFYGSEFSSRYINGENYSHNWQNLTASFSTNLNIQTKAVKGEITFQVDFILGYDYVEITPDDIGKVFSLNNHDFKVVDIIDNKVVLSIHNEIEEPEIDFKFVNLNDKGLEVSPLSLEDFNELKMQDSTLSFFSMGTGTGKLSQAVYDIFKSKPNIQFEEFDEKIHSKLLQLIEAEDKEGAELKYLGPKYTVIKTAGPISNLYLYCPIYGEVREFDLQL